MNEKMLATAAPPNTTPTKPNRREHRGSTSSASDATLLREAEAGSQATPDLRANAKSRANALQHSAKLH